MKKKIFIIATIMICLIIAMVCMLKIKKTKDIESYKQVGEYVLELYAENGRWMYASEYTFLEFCKNEEFATIVKRDIHIEEIDVLNDDAVLILREPWFWGIQGYIVVRDGGELPSDMMNMPYEDPDCKKIEDGVYSFKWASMP